MVEVCAICDIAECHHIRERQSAERKAGADADRIATLEAKLVESNQAREECLEIAARAHAEWQKWMERAMAAEANEKGHPFRDGPCPAG